MRSDEVHFSMDKPQLRVWVTRNQSLPQALLERIHVALKQARSAREAPCFFGGQRDRVYFLGYFFCTSKRSNSPAGEKGANSTL